jgi:predicted small lipoprotein YifL
MGMCRRRSVAALMLLAALSACGRKGALYMPGEEEDARRLPPARPGGEPSQETDGIPNTGEDSY